ncbi:MAG: hypothetical protein B6U72_04820 [Candidatus Altiarchaeales archaeon ex4484_2]|nr:MAG: hypothetical protein B6U72_04820 [Candidatus Altiarchaeales archaeon ex4484_2]
MKTQVIAKKNAFLILLLIHLIGLSNATGNLVDKWEFTADENIRSVGFTTIDNQSNVVIGAGKDIYLMDSEGNVIDEYTLDAEGFVTALASGDIDYDGVDEILVGVSYIETRDVNASYLDINKTDIGFSERIVYKVTVNEGEVYLIDDGKTTKFFDAEGWVREIIVENLGNEWEKNIIVASGGSELEYYRQRLPATSYEYSCSPNVKEVTSQNESKGGIYTLDVTKLGDDIETCRNNDACAPEIKSYFGNKILFEDCCPDWANIPECCNSSDKTCNGTFGYPEKKQCIFLADGLSVHDPDYPGEDQVASVGPGCYRVNRWQCEDLLCHKVKMQFRTEKTYNPIVSVYDTKGELMDTINFNNLNFSECTLEGEHIIENIEVVNVFEHISGKEIVFGSGPYLMVIDNKLEGIKGFFLGCDYLKNRYWLDELMDIADYRVYDIDQDNEYELVLTYPSTGALQVIDTDYNWVAGQCVLGENKTTGEETREYEVDFTGYISPDWTFRVPVGEKIERSYIVHIMPYNESQIIVLSPTSMNLVRYGLSGMLRIKNVTGVDDLYFHDLQGDGLQETLIVEENHIHVYETNPLFIKNVSANTYYEYAVKYLETEPYKAKNYLLQAMEVYKDIGNLDAINKSKLLLQEIDNRLREEIWKEGNNEYVKALTYYTYDNTKAKEHAMEALRLYSSINNTKGVTNCNDLIEKIDQRQSTTTSISQTPTTTSSNSSGSTLTISSTLTSNTITTEPNKGGGLEAWHIIPAVIIIMGLFYLFYHRLVKKSSKPKKKAL